LGKIISTTLSKAYYKSSGCTILREKVSILESLPVLNTWECWW